MQGKLFCVESSRVTEARLAKLLTDLGATPAPGNSITLADVFICDCPDNDGYLKLIAVAAEMGKRVCVIDPTRNPGVDGDNIEWFSSIPALECHLQEETAVTA